MSEPTIPDVDQDQSLVDLLESIALEETALAHVENAEGEKLQAIVTGLLNNDLTVQEVLDLQDSVDDTLKTTVKKQMLLQFKLEDILDSLEPIPPVDVQANTGTVTAVFDDTTVTDSDDAFFNTETTTQEVNNS
ncbi:hypothetical protein [Halanaerobaculum tunisiense]